MKKEVFLLIGTIMGLTAFYYFANGSMAGDDYVMVWPILDAESEKPREMALESHELTLIARDQETFLLVPKIDPVRKKQPGWYTDKSLKERGLLGKRDGNRVEINGILYEGGYLGFRLHLTGESIDDQLMKGSLHYFMIPPPSVKEEPSPPIEYHAEWCLYRKGSAVPEISRQVTYHGPKLERHKPEIPTPEEEAKRPPIDDRYFKYIASLDLKSRNPLILDASLERKAYYDILLAELTWEEIRYTPGILLLIDHLAKLEPTDRRRIAKSYVRDGSLDFFGDIPYPDLQKVPPHFLILKCLTLMPAADLEGLNKESPKFAALLAAVHDLSPAQLAAFSLDDLVLEVSRRLSPDFRHSYFQSSRKLQAYVAASPSPELRQLYHFPPADNQPEAPRK